jgi:hypothetical protein
MDFWRRSARKSRKEKVLNVTIRELMEAGKNILQYTAHFDYFSQHRITSHKFRNSHLMVRMHVVIVFKGLFCIQSLQLFLISNISREFRTPSLFLENCGI